ncbi:hypothetical protein BO78DRAFT_398838 [Aspergillus sclerotiicarbonarius CBS 121057]|uniref:Uncharacterized protein n=1 Tax=Aspergillus sclerotiicarbonarius (strain CBS 121057 / IBT 28362) TaxID=1448318 RepID=A0A319E385_ASPSB|nr:hypothetical protein BO78DRAFT_398838 [Aspergillus sclerotiicarbonarius CBS 121057]
MDACGSPDKQLQGGTCIGQGSPHQRRARLRDCEGMKTLSVLQNPGRRRVYTASPLGSSFISSSCPTRCSRLRVDVYPQGEKSMARGCIVQPDAKSMLRGLAFGRLQDGEIRRGSSGRRSPNPPGQTGSYPAHNGRAATSELVLPCRDKTMIWRPPAD